MALGQPPIPLPQPLPAARSGVGYTVGVVAGLMIVAVVVAVVLIFRGGGSATPTPSDASPTASPAPTAASPSSSAATPTAASSPSQSAAPPSASPSAAWHDDMPTKVGGWKTSDADQVPVRYTKGGERLVAMVWPLELSDMEAGLEGTKPIGDYLCGYAQQQEIPTCLVPLPEQGVLQISSMSGNDTIVAFGDDFLKAWGS